MTPVVKRAIADSYKSANVALLTALAGAPLKVPIITVTVQFQTPSRIEVSSGLMVPFSGFHTYSKAEVASGGVVSDDVVQKTITFSVVPMAYTNLLAFERNPNGQRLGLFATGGIGYNPATNSVEFGAGGTFSYRSIAISFLADIGRDTKLAGGFTVGQSLGPTNAAATPLTTTYWTIRPAMALSVRIPLGGGASKSL